jgi:hypothetical protein
MLAKNQSEALIFNLHKRAREGENIRKIFAMA